MSAIMNTVKSARVRLRHLFVLLREVFRFAWDAKEWWIVPVILILLLLSLIIVVGSTTAPLIYTIF